MILQLLFLGGIPPPNNERAIESQRPDQKKKKNKNKKMKKKKKKNSLVSDRSITIQVPITIRFGPSCVC